MGRVAYVSHADCGRHDTGWGHPEHVGRLRAIPRALRLDLELYHALEHVEARQATPAEIELTHDPGYVARVRRMAESGGGHLDPDTPVSAGSWDAALAAAGCVITAVDLTRSGPVRRVFCAVRPPGHHALRDRGMGFCLFGNVAIGVHHARRSGVERVLVVDWDVHHGNGTQALVEGDPGVHFVSLHQAPWYPGTGLAGDRGPHANVWNVPRPPGLASEKYLEALREAVNQATEDFCPGIVIVSAGFDCLAGDPLGGFTLEPSELASFTTELVRAADEWCDGRLVAVLEGGYVPARLADAALSVMRAMQ